MMKEIAIIGMAGRFPEAGTIYDLLNNLRNGTDSVKPASFYRIYHTDNVLDEKYRIAGLIDDVDCFDNSFFGISKSEAINMDPHQRILLEVAHETFENTGLHYSNFAGSLTSVFIAVPEFNYADFYPETGEVDNTALTGNKPGLTAGRISRFFDLRGTSLVVNTECSSALTAIYLACNELNSGQCEMAFIGAAHLFLNLEKENAGGVSDSFNSSSGKSKAFAADADGIATGEAVCGLILKPLEKAIMDGDVVYGIIKGISSNQDANTSSFLTAPSVSAQSEVIKRAISNSGLDAEDIGALEAHGTGTELGDPIEVKALDEVYKMNTDFRHFCALTSVKSNLGHTGFAAGLTGMIKLVLALHNKELYPSLHFNDPNPFIDFSDSCFYINTRLRRWEVEEGKKRYAGLSSFGLSGTNCHVVLEEGVTTKKDLAHPINNTLVTIAAPETVFEEFCQRICGYLEQHTDILLHDLVKTLQLRSGDYEARYATYVHSIEELKKILKKNPIPQVCLPPEETIILFSGEYPSENIISLYCSNFTSFSDAYNKCVEFKPLCADKKIFEAFAFGYSFFYLLEAKGVSSKNLLGIGLGTSIVTVLNGRITLKEAISSLEHKQEDAVPERLTKYIDDRIKDRNVFFIESGLKGMLSETLLNIRKKKGSYSVFAVSDEDEKGIVDRMIQDLFLSGFNVNWNNYTKCSLGQRVDLPPLPFVKEHSWINNRNKAKIQSWVYEPKWEEVQVIKKSDVHKNWLAFIPGGKQEISYWRKMLPEGTIFVLECADICDDKDVFFMPSVTAKDFEKLRSTLLASQIEYDGIVYILSPENIDRLEECKNTDFYLERSLYTVFRSVQAFESDLKKNDFSFIVCTKYAEKVLEEDIITSPFQSSVRGFILSLGKEYPQLITRYADIYSDKDIKLALAEEADKDFSQQACAFRNGKQYFITLQRKNKLEAISTTSFKMGGNYLITGGGSGMGLLIANYLFKRYKANLFIIGRRSEYELAEAIPVFDEIKKEGGVVFYFQADISDEIKMKSIADEIEKTYNGLNGIIHSAGIPGKERLAEYDEYSFKEALIPKINGTMVLLSVFNCNKLDFITLFSSHSAYVGYERMTNYASANVFLEHAALALKNRGIHAMAISWPGWSETGIWHRFSKSDASISDQSVEINSNQGMHILELTHCNIKPLICISKNNPSLFKDSKGYFVSHNEHVNALEELSGNDNTDFGNTVEQASDLIIENKEGWTPLQNTIAAIWKEVLMCKNPLLTDDFFTLGGHSLNGAQVINRIEKIYKVKLAFKVIFANPSIKSLSDYLETIVCSNNITEHKMSDLDKKIILPLPQQEYYSLSGAEKRLWILDQLNPDLVAYNMPYKNLIEGNINIEVFRRAVYALIERHEVLRTTYHEIDGMPLKKIHSTDHFSGNMISFLDLSSHPDKKKYLEDWHEQEMQIPFDLEKGPLLRIQLFQTSEKTFYLFFNLHHIISDGWSMDVFRKDLMLLYEAFSHGNASGLKPLAFQYKEFADWLNKYQESNNASEDKRYWFKVFDTIPVSLNLPLDFPRPEVKTFKGASVKTIFSRESSVALRHLAQSKGLSLYMLLQAILKAMLFRVSGQTDIVIGTPLSGRVREDLEDQLGLYVNDLALRTRFNANDSFDVLLKKVEDNTFLAFEHQLFQLDQLIEMLKIPHTRSRHPLFEVLFVMQNKIAEGKDDFETEIEIEAQEVEVCYARFDLSFGFSDVKEEIALITEYNVGLFKPASIKFMNDILVKIADAIIHNPEISLTSIPIHDMESDKPASVQDFDFSF